MNKYKGVLGDDSYYDDEEETKEPSKIKRRSDRYKRWKEKNQLAAK